MKSTSTLLMVTLIVLAAWIAPGARTTLGGATLLEYNIDLVSDYVDSGDDVFVSVFSNDGEDQGPFNFSPALQPSITFLGGSGFSFTFAGSFALTDRDENPATGFPGLGNLDEIVLAPAMAWENRLGGFEAWYEVTTFPGQGDGDGGANEEEIFFAWAFPFLEALAPTLTVDAVTSGSTDYTTEISIEGGDSLFWGAALEHVRGGILAVTAHVGLAASESLSVSFNAAHRPKPELHDVDGLIVDGKFTNTQGQQEEIPGTIFWLTLSHGGSVGE